jgi:hypothetical protein
MIASESPFAQIMTGFGCIRLHSLLEPSNLIFLAVSLFDTGMYNVLFFSGAKKSFTNSTEWIKKMKSLHGNDKMKRRVLRSMLPLRVWFGNNYVDRMTPLAVQQFCWIQTANLLLLV